MLKLYEGAYDDLLNDIDKDIVISDIKSWIKEGFQRKLRRLRDSLKRMAGTFERGSAKVRR